MRFLVVSSPHGYTTRDVWKRVMTGLEMNGQEVRPYDLLPRWRAFDMMIDFARKAKKPLPDGFYSNLLAYEPILGAAHYHECDAVIVVSPQYCPVPLIEVLKKSGKTTIAYFTECPYEDSMVAPIQSAAFDYTFVNDRYSVGLFQSFCENVAYLPHSYDPALHHPGDGEKDSKISFIGTFYPSRLKLFTSVNWDGLDLDLYGIHWFDKRYKLSRYVRGDILENEEVANIYRRSAVGISAHREQRYVNAEIVIDENEAYSVGPRTWELAACGTFQVSDYRRELMDTFGDSVLTYKTPGELERICRRAIDDPVWREELAGQQRAAVEGHDCGTTMRTLLERVAA